MKGGLGRKGQPPNSLIQRKPLFSAFVFYSYHCFYDHCSIKSTAYDFLYFFQRTKNNESQRNPRACPNIRDCNYSSFLIIFDRSSSKFKGPLSYDLQARTFIQLRVWDILAPCSPPVTDAILNAITLIQQYSCQRQSDATASTRRTHTLGKSLWLYQGSGNCRAGRRY